MSHSKHILKLTFVMFTLQTCCFLVSAQIGTDSITLNILQRREYPLSFGEQFKQQLSYDILVPSIEIRKSLTLDFPLKYEAPKYENRNHNLHLDKISFLSYPHYSLGENAALYMSRTDDLLPGVAAMNNINAGLVIHPTENWYINISNSAYKYRDFTGIYNDYTINASSYVSLSDNLGINVYGSYSTQAMNNTVRGAMPYSPFAPYSYYGGSIEFKITDKFGIEAGMLRQFNTWTRRWKNMYYVKPKFYK